MLGAPKVKAVRGFSDFGYSYVYVIFEDGTDIYWARSRTLEYLSGVLPRLPQGVQTELGPDATGVGWVFQYALVDTTRPAQPRRAALATRTGTCATTCKSVPGVAEVAPLGGFVRQYQVNVDPNRLRAYDIPISKVVEAVRGGNNDVGGRLVEFSGAEYMVRGRGYAQVDRRHRRASCSRAATSGVAGPRARRRRTWRSGPTCAAASPTSTARATSVAGIVVMRQGENALHVIERVKAKLEEIEPGAAAGRQGRHDLRPLGADPARRSTT